ncbi:MAG: DNA replication and repair protein RecF [bacterium]|nr:DNA replication and repair protein RecF [bacterium]
MVEKLWIRQFRNLKETVVSLPGGKPVFVVGNNNQGKTNLLEAIYCLGHGDSPRAGELERVVRIGEQMCTLGADIKRENGELDRIYIKLFSDGKREAMLNDEKVSRRAQLAHIFPVQYLSADVIELMQGYSDSRRRDLVRFCELNVLEFPHHFTQLQGVLKQKRHLLKQGAPVSDFQLWNQRLVACSVPVVECWLSALSLISKQIEVFARELPRLDIQTVAFEFVAKRLDSDISTGLEYGEKLAFKLQEGMNKERHSGMVLYGPQTDDYRVLVNGLDLRHYYSRGINRIFSILTKLAQLCVLRDKGTALPVLLLDDVLAEVDDEMRHAVMAIVMREVQVVYTSTNKMDKDLFNDVSMLRVEEGSITHEGA